MCDLYNGEKMNEKMKYNGEKIFCPFLVKKAFFRLFSNHLLHFLKFFLEILTKALNYNLGF